jgi:hypothetical protein
MRRVWQQMKRRRGELATHAFFEWFNSDAVPAVRRFVFSPVMVDFIMGFADMNKWFLSYADPQTQLERAINQHTEEDRTHSRLFYENWYTLHLGDPARWAPGKLLWWLFQAKETSVIRRFGMQILNLSVNNPDPFVRFSMMESIEICGDVFFGNTAPIAESLSERHGVSHRYFGQYHRVRETGHLHADETAFTKAHLSDKQASRCAEVVDRIFNAFVAVLDQNLSYALRSESDPVALAVDLESEYQVALEPPYASDWALEMNGDEAFPSTGASSQLPALRRLNERLDRLEGHSFLNWLREDDAKSPLEKLQSFIALWAFDIVGYKDFNELVLRYPVVGSPMDRTINRWTEDLATHSALYLQDWQALKMDRVLRWDAGETIAFYFLSPETEVHRRNMAKLKHYAFRNPQAELRWWLMTALEKGGDALFACTRRLAEAVEEKHGITLNYWSKRHDLAHGPAEERLGAASFLAQEISPSDCETVCGMIDTVYDNLEEQFSLSLEMATSRVFLREPASLPPPPRLSDVVPKSNTHPIERRRAV